MGTSDYKKLKQGDEVIFYRSAFVLEPRRFMYGVNKDTGNEYELFQLPRDKDELLRAMDSDIRRLTGMREQVISSCRAREAAPFDPLKLR